ncbi:MAG: NAD(P)-dependent oxidoreductase [Prevotella bivia]|uniref:NAD dependent epimerase/dehydratase family protein n=1 Tax=Prevotella bivia TaxID=28125 RepID=A0A137SQD8_9BACT|nr:NAD(P)-dependent oxidoreductase [Prevotella bivia]KXO14710.1 NAD dependent epimerase/dehydratase family protein [Prevotella bivia]KXU55998.1 NAD dependent epimerase/dehydratase family protein [Prevotella bivia]MDU6553397.1 NAD(P)-dependent oxidoreductase [Prevotella bivia]MDZ3817608.1 NAD(P)-dependent oxidoreductase [Prevotella bivia]
MSKKVIVFGATGNLGAPISVYLKQNGYDVIAVGHRTSDNGFFEDMGIPYYSVDIENAKQFDVLPTDDIYAVAHFASSLPSRYEYNPRDLFESITIGTLNVLEWMRKIGCKKIVFPQTPSDMASYHNCGKMIPEDAPREFPLTGDHAVYTIAKNAAVDLIENYHAEYGFSRFVFRFFTIYEYHPNAYHYRNYKHLIMPFRMLMDRASKSLPIEIWGNCKKAKEMVYIKDFIRLVKLAIDSDIEGGIYNVGNGWQVSLEEQILGIIKVFSPKDNPSPVIYVKDKPDPLENAFEITKIKRDFGYEPLYTYIQQLEDFKHDMETEPFAKLWGTKEDYEPKESK